MTPNYDLMLIRAARSGDVKQVQALLAQGANANASDRDGTTALMFAAQQGYTEIVKVLCDRGADLNLRRKLYGITALMLAAANHRVDALELLLAKGADVNAKKDRKSVV